jgi:hypothetical protein
MTQRPRSTPLPPLGVLIRREVELFEHGEPVCDEYVALRTQWPALRARSTAEAVRALALVVSARLGVSAAVLTPIVASLVDGPEGDRSSLW